RERGRLPSKLLHEGFELERGGVREGGERQRGESHSATDGSGRHEGAYRLAAGASVIVPPLRSAAACALPRGGRDPPQSRSPPRGSEQSVARTDTCGSRHWRYR